MGDCCKISKIRLEIHVQFLARDIKVRHFIVVKDLNCDTLLMLRMMVEASERFVLSWTIVVQSSPLSKPLCSFWRIKGDAIQGNGVLQGLVVFPTFYVATGE